jgi:hypothetical protein
MKAAINNPSGPGPSVTDFLNDPWVLENAEML